MSESGLQTEPGLKDLLQAGLHFGHQTRRWNPRMRRYIHGERDGIHIIDLLQTEQLLNQARDFAVEVAGKGGTVLFVGTKKQARDSVKSWAERCGMPFVNQRWLGGLLTNFQTMSARIDRLHELNSLKDEGRLESSQVSLGKLNNVREAIAIARECRTILGAAGITLEYPVLRHANNLESVLTYEGTSEVHQLVIGQALTGEAAFR